MSEKLTVQAAAKVNLFLEVLEERDDGYHELRSVVAPIGLFDTIELEVSRDSIETTVDVVDLPHEQVAGLNGGTGNLATKAARLLKEAAGYEGGARIHITKRIPVGGGLGGGSADAAATLRGLNQLWGTGLGDGELSSLCRQLGSDVCAMMAGRPVLVGGIGEQIEELTVDPFLAESGWWLVVANPGFMVSTKDSYERYSRVLTSGAGQLQSMVSALKDGSIDLAASCIFNSLQPSVFAKYPLLPMMAERMHGAGALGVILCGSGASIFGLASSEASAYGMCDAIREDAGPALWARVAQILPDSVMVAHGPLEARV